MKFNLYCFDDKKLKEIKDKKKKSKDFDFLLKKGNGYKEEKKENLQSFPGFEFKIFHSSPKNTPPDWLKFINQGLKDEKIKLLKKSVSLLILLKINKSGIYFAITFGSSHYALDKDNIIDDFGLKTVLNSIDPSKVTLIDGKKIGSNTKETRTIFSKSTDFYNFGLDELEELLTKLEGLPENFDLGVKLSGKDSLSFSLVLSNNFTFAKLGEQIEKYYNNYGLKIYEKHFKFIDNYKIETSTEIVKKLNKKLIKYLLLKKNDYLNISIGFPNLLDHVDIYNIQIEGIGDKLDLLNEELILPEIKLILEKTKSDTIKKLKDIKVYAIEFQNENETEKFSFYRCINFETEISGNKYILHNGIWNIVDKDFLNRVNNNIDKLKFVVPKENKEELQNKLDKNLKGNIQNYKDFGLNIIPFDGKTHTKKIITKKGDEKTLQDEGAYNKVLSSKNGGLCLDTKNFTDLPGSSQIEICDILLHDKFIHIKRGNSSSNLSHLYNQGSVSLALFRKHEEYIADIQGRIKKHNEENPAKKIKWKMKDINKVEVILGIIINGNIKSRIPFFSKITLIKTSLEIKAMGGELIIIQISDNTK